MKQEYYGQEFLVVPIYVTVIDCTCEVSLSCPEDIPDRSGNGC